MRWKSVLWSVFFLCLLALLVYVFWPRAVGLPLADSNDPLVEVFKQLPCRDEFPSRSRAVIRFYDEHGVPIDDRVYTVTPFSVHVGAIDDPDVKFRTGWYWVANAKVDWCGAAKELLDADDYYSDFDVNLKTLRFSRAKECLMQNCDFSLSS